MFGQKTQPAWFFDSSVHLEAVSRLLYLVDSHESLGIVCGPDGSGRTRVLSRFREELAPIGATTVSLTLRGLDDELALCQLATCLSIVLRPDARRREMLTVLRDDLTGRGQCGIRTVILLDDFHRSAGDLSGFLRILLTIAADCHGMLTLVVASDRPLSGEFSDQSLVRVNLSALDTAESSDFVRMLIRRYSIRPSVVDESAIRAVSEISIGNVAFISRICELFRVLHETSPETRINEETVHAVLTELSPEAGRTADFQTPVMRAC